MSPARRADWWSTSNASFQRTGSLIVDCPSEVQSRTYRLASLSPAITVAVLQYHTAHSSGECTVTAKVDFLMSWGASDINMWGICSQQNSQSRRDATSVESYWTQKHLTACVWVWTPPQAHCYSDPLLGGGHPPWGPIALSSCSNITWRIIFSLILLCPSNGDLWPWCVLAKGGRVSPPCQIYDLQENLRTFWGRSIHGFWSSRAIALGCHGLVCSLPVSSPTSFYPTLSHTHPIPSL